MNIADIATSVDTTLGGTAPGDPAFADPAFVNIGALDLIPAEIALLDGDGTIRRGNRAWRRTAAAGGLGAPAQGRPAWNYLDECRAAARRGCGEGEAALLGLGKVLAGAAEPFVMNYPCPFKGRHHWYQLTASPLDEAGGGPGVLVMHLDVTSLQQDPLTGLANRALLEAHLQQAILGGERASAAGAVILVDLDGFKPINDTHGHQAGDALLVAVARRLKGVVRNSDLVARMGGDEFAVVLAGEADRAQARAVGERILEALNGAFDLGFAKARIGASAGLAFWPAHGVDPETLVGAADAALYAAKRSGRGRLVIADRGVTSLAAPGFPDPA